MLQHNADPLLEQSPLLERQRIGLGDDRDNVDDLCELLQDNDVNLQLGQSQTHWSSLHSADKAECDLPALVYVQLG